MPAEQMIPPSAQLTGAAARSPEKKDSQTGSRFEFGRNWSRFLRLVDEERIAEAEASLKQMLEVDSLAGRSFLDVGSGSGLFSLAARRLGARVHSFDYDPQSVACTREMKRRWLPDDSQWTIEQGSALDAEYLDSLGQFDVVYSWGVLHHTGQMWQALGHVVGLVRPHGRLFVSIYNDQRWLSGYWKRVKQLYNRGVFFRVPIVALHVPYLLGARFTVRALTGRLRVERGMSLWYDMIDWLGGYPFEVATPEAICHFYRQRGLTLARMKTCGGRSGCNEFVFVAGDAKS